jgi:hypothetical protein
MLQVLFFLPADPLHAGIPKNEKAKQNDNYNGKRNNKEYFTFQVYTPECIHGYSAKSDFYGTPPGKTPLNMVPYLLYYDIASGEKAYVRCMYRG